MSSSIHLLFYADTWFISRETEQWHSEWSECANPAELLRQWTLDAEYIAVDRRDGSDFLEIRPNFEARIVGLLGQLSEYFHRDFDKVLLRFGLRQHLGVLMTYKAILQERLGGWEPEKEDICSALSA